MFIRIKNIKNKEGKVYPYAYLVGNKWYKRGSKGKGKGSRQRVMGYLGRVYSFSKVDDIGFFDYLKVDDVDRYIGKGKNEIVRNLIEWELYRQDIKGFNVDFRGMKVTKEDKEISLRINEGFLNSYTLRKLLRFRFTGEEREDGLRLAKGFVEAGLVVPKEVFVGIFSKI